MLKDKLKQMKEKNNYLRIITYKDKFQQKISKYSKNIRIFSYKGITTISWYGGYIRIPNTNYTSQQKNQILIQNNNIEIVILGKEE